MERVKRGKQQGWERKGYRYNDRKRGKETEGKRERKGKKIVRKR